MNFISSRDVIVRSKNTGMSILFKKGVATKVPEAMYEEVLEKGVVPVEGEAPVDPAKLVDAGKPKIVLPPEDGLVRAKQILAVLKELVKRNNATEFTAGGTPSATAVTAALGWKVDQKEVRQVWEKNRAKILQGDALTLE